MILGRVIFDFPYIIALCHATPQTSRRARLSGFAPLHLPCIYYGFSLQSSRSSRPPSRTPSIRPGPFSLVNVSYSSHSTHGQSELQVTTSPFTGTEAPFHVVFSRISLFFHLAHLCSALIEPKWVFLKENCSLLLSLVALSTVVSSSD